MEQKKIDLSFMLNILSTDLFNLTQEQIKLAIMYSMLHFDHKPISSLPDSVIKLFKNNKKSKKELFLCKINEAIEELISGGTLIQFGKYNSSVKKGETFLDDFKALKNGTYVPKKIKKPDVTTEIVPRRTDPALLNDPKEIIWYLKELLLIIRQNTSSQCKGCDIAHYISEHFIENIDQELVKADFSDERFRKIATMIKKIAYRSAEISLIKEKTK